MIEQALDVIQHGIGGGDIAYAGVRAMTGAFFTISGYHKLFNRQRHASLVQTLKDDHVPLVSFNQWWVPAVEFCCGTALGCGLLTPAAALMLFVICLVASCTDGLKRIIGWQPLDRADYIDDILYLPEAVYCLMLFLFICNGGGRYSLDAIIGGIV